MHHKSADSIGCTQNRTEQPVVDILPLMGYIFQKHNHGPPRYERCMSEDEEMMFQVFRELTRRAEGGDPLNKSGLHSLHVVLTANAAL